MRIPFFSKKSPAPVAEVVEAVTPKKPPVVKKVVKTVPVPIEFGAQNGHQIFVYVHRTTNQVIYSLDRNMNVHLPPFRTRPRSGH